MHKANFTAQLSNKSSVYEIAKAIGCVQTRGEGKGEGSPREMLEGIGAGDILVLFTALDDPRDMQEAAATVRKLAASQDSEIKNLLKGLAGALENAAKVRE